MKSRGEAGREGRGHALKGAQLELGEGAEWKDRGCAVKWAQLELKRGTERILKGDALKGLQPTVWTKEPDIKGALRKRITEGAERRRELPQ
jgi:hypothetical protein